MNRRIFLGAAASTGFGQAAPQASPIPIIDTHIHLFDPSRPQGVPWPDKGNTILYQPALPERYRKIAVPLGVAGAIEVECSTWLEDNQWVLDVAAKDTIIVGTVGNLEPGAPEFRPQLERFHKNPLFRGIRYGTLWGRNIGAELSKPDFVAGLKALADADLALDAATPSRALIAALVKLTDQIPNLRVVIDHLPQFDPPVEPVALGEYRANLRELGKRPQVYAKVSEVLRRVGEKVPVDLDFYRSRIDELWDVFGQDRLLYASDWPNSDQWAPYPRVFNVVHEYFSAKGPAVAEKFFWRNSVAAYRWVKREPGQPSAAGSVVAAGALSRGLAPAVARKMKMCLHTGMIGAKANLAESIAFAVKYGFEAVQPNAADLAALPDSELSRLRDDLSAKKLVFGAVSLSVPVSQDEKFAALMKDLAATAKTLQRAGVKRATTWLRCSDASLTYLKNFRLHTQKIGEVATVLGDQGLVLGLEYVAPKTAWTRDQYPFIHTMETMKELIEATGKRNLGLLLDAWHWYNAGETAADLLTLKNEDIVAVYVNDAPAGIPLDQQVDSRRGLPMETGVIDIGAFLNALNQVGYDGPVAAEPMSAELRSLAAEEAVARTAQAMQKAFALIR